MKWFTADLHLGHTNIIKYCNRPFKTVQEMDSALINNITSRLKPGDDLYILGDLTFNAEIAKKFFKTMKLHGITTYFVIGNHDSDGIIKLAHKHCRMTGSILQHKNIIMCHYAMRTWPGSHHNTWQLYGHTHGRLPPIGKQHDVGVDNNNNQPIPLKEIERIMQTKPNNT